MVYTLAYTHKYVSAYMMVLCRQSYSYNYFSHLKRLNSHRQEQCFLVAEGRAGKEALFVRTRCQGDPTPYSHKLLRNRASNFALSLQS